MSQDLVPIPRLDSPPAVPACSVQDVLDAWLDGRNPNTLRGYRFDIGDFGRFLKIKAGDPAAAVEAILSLGHGMANRVALAYRADLLGRGLAPATIARRLSALRSMVDVGRQLGRISWTLDVEGPRIEAYRDTRGPGLENWRKMLAKAGERAAEGPLGRRNLALIRLLHDHGLRRGEAVAMDLADVDLVEGRISIVGKGKLEPIALTLNDPTREALRAWVAARGGGTGSALRPARSRGRGPGAADRRFGRKDGQAALPRGRVAERGQAARPATPRDHTPLADPRSSLDLDQRPDLLQRLPADPLDPVEIINRLI